MNYSKLTKKELVELLNEKERIYSPKITSPEGLTEHLSDYRDRDVEYFLIVTLDAAHRPIKTHEITKGILDRSLVHPREVFRAAVVDNAKSVIVAHNHPSGNLEPSTADYDITYRLRKAGEIIGIEVLDHIILTKFGHRSMYEHNELDRRS